MADVKAVDERAELPEKRKLDLAIPVDESPDEKRPKFQVPSEKNGSAPPAAAENAAEPYQHLTTRAAAAEGDEENDDEDEDDYSAEEEEEEETEIVDRKGKGVMIDLKGKGKMIEESEDDDDDDDSDDDDSSDDSGSGFSDGLDESDLEDDPLAEVDLDNILPSRTRRRQAQPGFRIFGDSGKGNDV